MSHLSPAIFQKWIHSREEDTGDQTVYRPQDYPFPPARGRAGLEFRPDGTVIYYAIGRGDAPDSIAGRWHAQDSATLSLSYANEARQASSLEILSVDPQRLVVRGTP